MKISENIKVPFIEKIKEGGLESITIMLTSGKKK